MWAHPLAIHRDQLPDGLTPARDLDRHVGRRVTVAGWLVHGQRTKTVHGEQMKFLTMEDKTAIYEVTLFPRAYQRTGHNLAGGTRGPFLVTGRVEDEDGYIMITGEKLEPLSSRYECATTTDSPALAPLQT